MIPTLWQLILVGCGGAVGAMLRLCANQLTVYLWGERFPWGTLIVNLIGCFLLGFVIRLGAPYVSENIRLAIGVGLLGGLTTFSSFSAEIWIRINSEDWPLAIVTLLANVTGGLLLVGLGAGLASIWLGPES
ncbi:MAG: CrcB family protein [Planctomycetota bacterium]|nr:CrcB family protein [Planctomycetota bacterium]